jgi:hypothetical protein
VSSRDAPAARRVAVDRTDEERAGRRAELGLTGLGHGVAVELEPVVHDGDLVAHRLREGAARARVNAAV